MEWRLLAYYKKQNRMQAYLMEHIVGVGEETLRGINAIVSFVCFLPMEVGTVYIPQERKIRLKNKGCLPYYFVFLPLSIMI